MRVRGIPADRPAEAYPQENWLEPPPQPPAPGSDPPLEQQDDANVENIFFSWPLPHDGHRPAASSPPLPAE
jgi:hypothetical protein